MAIVGAIVAGIVLPAGAFRGAAPAPDNLTTESIPVTDPISGRELPTTLKSDSVIDSTEGGSSVTQQFGAPASIELSPAEDWNPIKTQHTFTITVKRADGSPSAGAAMAPDVQLVDQLPAGLQYVSASPEPDLNINNVLSWSLEDIAVGESAGVTMSLQGVAIGNQENIATAISGEYSGTDTLSTGVLASSLMVSKTGPSQVNFNEEFNYDATVINNGNGALTNVVATDALPAEFTLVSNEPAAEAAATDAGPSWNLGTLAQGESKPVTLTVSSATAGDYVNRVSVTSDEGQTGSAEASTTVQTPTVTVTKTANPDTILVGEQTTFTITATNNGDGFLSNISVVDNLPDGMEMVSTTPEATMGNDGSLSWTIDRVKAGASETFTIVAQGNAGGSTTVTLTLRGQRAGEFTTEASVTTDQGVSSNANFAVSVLAAAGATLQLSDNPDPVGIDEQVTYTATLTNHSLNSSITYVRATVDIPEEFTIVDSGTGVATGNSVAFPAVETLGAGQTRTYTITVQANAADDVVAQATLEYNEFSRPIIAQEGTTIVDR